MAPQKVETIALPQHCDDCNPSCDSDRRETPDIIEPVQEDDGWMFPKNWSDEDKRDWLVTHPTGVETVTIADGGENGDAGMEADRDEYEKSYDEQLATEAEVISALKADGVYAAAIAVPPALRDVVNSENYDPRQFFLVHSEVWNDMVEATQAEAELGLENKELRKQLNAQKRGMRKVNKHWSATKRELKQLERENSAAHQAYRGMAVQTGDRHREELRRQGIFATRLARRLRKARAGRDKRERQLNLANQHLAAQDSIIARQDEYIGHLERILGMTKPL